MVKLDVLISGLVDLVLPERGRGPGIVLLPRATRKFASDGEPIPVHYAVIKFRPKRLKIPHAPEFQWGPQQRAVLKLEGEDVRFIIDHPHEPDLSVKNREGLIDFEKILGSRRLSRMKSGCLGPHPCEECTINGRPILAGRVFLYNGEVRPVEINKGEYVVNPREELWGFISPLDPDKKSDFIGQVFGAILFSATLEAAEDVQLQIGEIRVPLRCEPKLTEVDLRENSLEVPAVNADENSASIASLEGNLEYEDEGVACSDRILIEVENLPLTEHAGHAEEDLVDRHFEIFYDLLEHSVEPLVPVLRLKKEEGSVNPPGSRCVPAAGTN